MRSAYISAEKTKKASGWAAYVLYRKRTRPKVACGYIFCFLSVRVVRNRLGGSGQRNIHGHLSSFNIPGIVMGIVVCALIAVIIYGGLKRIVTVTEKFVPFMAAFYIIGALIIIIVNFRHIGDAFGEIFSGAFSMRSVGGGVMGYGISRAMRFGVARGVFSNEAGLGSSVMVHSSSDAKEPVTQVCGAYFRCFLTPLLYAPLRHS